MDENESEMYIYRKEEKHRVISERWLKFAMVHAVLHTRRPSGETLNRGPDSLWSLKIPGCPSKKSRGVTPASRPNSPIGL